MSTRHDLIARKHEIRRHIEQVRRRLEHAQNPPDGKPNVRRIRKLEQQLEALTAQEYALRIAIDQAKM